MLCALQDGDVCDVFIAEKDGDRDTLLSYATLRRGEHNLALLLAAASSGCWRQRGDSRLLHNAVIPPRGALWKGCCGAECVEKYSLAELDCGSVEAGMEESPMNEFKKRDKDGVYMALERGGRTGCRERHLDVQDGQKGSQANDQ